MGTESNRQLSSSGAESEYANVALLKSNIIIFDVLYAVDGKRTNLKDFEL